MTSSLNHFHWPVSPDGYEWIEPIFENPEAFEPCPGPLLRPSGETPLRYWKPMAEKPGLFSEFAALELTRDAISAFAAQHGHLGVSQVISPDTDGSVGERLRDWQAEILHMRLAVNLWRAVTSWPANTRPKAVENVAGFGCLLEQPRFVSIGFEPNERPSHLTLYYADDLREFLERPPSDRRLRLVSLAVAFIGALINDHLDGQCSWIVIERRLPLSQGRDERQGRADRRKSPSKIPQRVLQPRLRPSTLLSAMWLQLAEAVTTEKYRFCEREGCNRLIPIGVASGGHRTNRRYCEGCRMPHLRQKKARVRVGRRGKTSEERSHA